MSIHHLLLLLILPSFLTSPSNLISAQTQLPVFNISFPSFDSRSCSEDLICLNAVSASNGSLNITPQQGNTTLTFQLGRVLYRRPVRAWPATLSTEFTFRVIKDASSKGYGDGMAFVLAPDTSPSPPSSFGSYLGLFNQSTEGGRARQLAVEFDTYKNEQDPDANHIAIDTVSVERPVAVRSLNDTGIDLKSGRPITVRIDYDGWTKKMQIYVAYAGDPLVSFLNHTMKMKGKVPSSVYVGFTGATGTLTETHEVLSWNFTSIELPKKSLGSETKKIVVIVVPTILGLLFLAALAFPFARRAHRKKQERIARKRDIEMLIEAANGPRLFSYRKLSKATRNFSKDNLLGTGGFGSVYKGVLSDPPTIAVKKITATSSQGGEKEYLAEICTIGQLRHKNIVQLQGWCHGHDQLLLVYEYMSNGSLDKYIGRGKETCLDWPTRYNILHGLASALLYLHEECGRPVVHRDVKPNNVLLDENYNAHLGDFGLARLLKNKSSVTTIIAGTPGYLAPEVSFSGRATTESDVYSFGMVVLELVCGRRSSGILDENCLLETVWSCYEKGELLNCVDELLEEKYDEEQVKRCLVVGLACLHPDCMLRPRMRKVVQIFMNPEEPLVDLPRARPLEIRLMLNTSPATTVDYSSNKAKGGDSVTSTPEESLLHYESAFSTQSLIRDDGSN